MKKRMSRIIVALGLIVLFAGVSTLAASTQLIESSNHKSSTVTLNQERIDMLVFVSPQYAYDTEIRTTINTYITAVRDDLGWNTKVIPLTQENNEYREIDKTIEEYYDAYKIKACIMVGEDTHTALGGDSGYMKKPSTVPWFTTGGEDSYEISEQGIVCQPYITDICVSLVYPTHDLDYQTKKSQIIYAFNKFSNERHVLYSKDILVFESSDINSYSQEMYRSLNDCGNLYYCEDPTDMEIEKSFSNSYAMYYVHGHSNPSGTDLNADTDGWFSADYLDELDTPFFGADGCYVGGWWSDKPNTNILDSSINCIWYGSKIFTSKNIKAMVLGLLSQNGFSYSVSFVENVIPDLSKGMTLAESLIGDKFLGENIIIGDPTFHYTI